MKLKQKTLEHIVRKAVAEEVGKLADIIASAGQCMLERRRRQRRDRELFHTAWQWIDRGRVPTRDAQWELGDSENGQSPDYWYCEERWTVEDREMADSLKSVYDTMVKGMELPPPLAVYDGRPWWITYWDGSVVSRYGIVNSAPPADDNDDDADDDTPSTMNSSFSSEIHTYIESLLAASQPYPKLIFQDLTLPLFKYPSRSISIIVPEAAFHPGDTLFAGLFDTLIDNLSIGILKICDKSFSNVFLHNAIFSSSIPLRNSLLGEKLGYNDMDCQEMLLTFTFDSFSEELESVLKNKVWTGIICNIDSKNYRMKNEGKNLEIEYNFPEL